MLSSQKKLEELYKGILDNGYLEDVLVQIFSKFNSLPMQGPDKYPIYLKLPWICKNGLDYSLYF